MNGSDKSYFLTDVGVLRAIGERAAVFLHNQLTNAIKDLTAGEGNYNLLLTNKGKVRADLFVINRGTYFDLLVPAIFIELVDAHLSKLAALSGVSVSRVPPLKVLHVLGEVPSDWPRLARDEAVEIARPDFPWLLYQSDRLGVAGTDVVLESEGLGHCEEFLQRSGFAKIPAEAAERIRIRSGTAKVGIDVTEENLPQEGRLERALHFNKGCYLGQEVIARLHFRGHVNKLLQPFYCNGDVAAADVHNAAGEMVGHVTSRIFDAVANRTDFLGYVPAKALSGNEAFFLAEQPLQRN